ncbi:hypothetical protein ABZ951_04420 [Streptomyces sp. NPDC046215]|uniref:Uncharacterized protein n=1 Tax=Streptomyces stramineus TaxID=173861 RepID=A0ABN0ZQQ5_9ACTN
MDFPDWKPRDLANASLMNTRMRDAHRVLSNPPRVSSAGVSTVGAIPDDGAYVPLHWDTVEEAGGWLTDRWSFTAPAGGFYFLTADLTALSPKEASKRPALRFVAMSRTPEGEAELLRSYNSTIVPNTFVTCSLRGFVYVEQGSALFFKANAPAGTGAWEISPGSRTSGHLNRFSAVLVAPGTSRQTNR